MHTYVCRWLYCAVLPPPPQGRMLNLAHVTAFISCISTAVCHSPDEALIWAIAMSILHREILKGWHVLCKGPVDCAHYKYVRDVGICDALIPTNLCLPQFRVAIYLRTYLHMSSLYPSSLMYVCVYRLALCMSSLANSPVTSPCMHSIERDIFHASVRRSAV